MIKKIAGIALFLVGLWLLMPVSFYGRGYWIYLFEVAKGLVPILLMILGILIFYAAMSKPKKR